MSNSLAGGGVVQQPNPMPQGCVEQAAAVTSGLKIAGWCILRDSGDPPEAITIEWADQTVRIAPTRLRPDVARTMAVPELLCGFDVVIPVPIEARVDWPEIKVFAHWPNIPPYLLPHLKVASEVFALARKQFPYDKAREASIPGEKITTANLARQEYLKYREIYNHTTYEAMPGPPREVKDFLSRYKLSPGDVIIDFGSGPGYASNYFHKEGLRVIAIDIAPNAMRDEFLGKFPLIVSAFWDLPAKLNAKWGYCTDVMEHIPPARIDEVLGIMSSSASNSMFFNISLRPDGCGAVFNKVRHLSVYPREWWEAKLLQFWQRCEFVRGSHQQYACFVVSDPRRTA